LEQWREGKIDRLLQIKIIFGNQRSLLLSMDYMYYTMYYRDAISFLF